METTNIKVKITKEILKKSMMCGTVLSTKAITENCAVALAIREIFPKAIVNPVAFAPGELGIYSKHNGEDFIQRFDSLSGRPKERLNLPETEVTLFIKDEVIEELNCQEGFDWRKTVNESKLLNFA